MHRHAHGVHLSVLNDNLVGEVAVAGLPHSDFVFSWQQQYLLISLELLDVPHINAVDPNACIPFYTGCTLELQLAHDLAVLCGRPRSRKQDAK